jgi:hypothetical protein
MDSMLLLKLEKRASSNNSSRMEEDGGWGQAAGRTRGYVMRRGLAPRRPGRSRQAAQHRNQGGAGDKTRGETGCSMTGKQLQILSFSPLSLLPLSPLSCWLLAFSLSTPLCCCAVDQRQEQMATAVYLSRAGSSRAARREEGRREG